MNLCPIIDEICYSINKVCALFSGCIDRERDKY